MQDREAAKADSIQVLKGIELKIESQIRDTNSAVTALKNEQARVQDHERRISDIKKQLLSFLSMHQPETEDAADDIVSNEMVEGVEALSVLAAKCGTLCKTFKKLKVRLELDVGWDVKCIVVQLIP